MNKSQEIKNLYSNFVSDMNNADAKLKNNLKKINKYYKDVLLSEKKKLLLEISNGENLNYNLLKHKYLNLENNNSDCENEILLNKTSINSIDYYYENKDNGNIYDKNSKKVGIFIDGKFILDPL